MENQTKQGEHKASNNAREKKTRNKAINKSRNKTRKKQVIIKKQRKK